MPKFHHMRKIQTYAAPRCRSALRQPRPLAFAYIAADSLNRLREHDAVAVPCTEC